MPGKLLLVLILLQVVLVPLLTTTAQTNVVPDNISTELWGLFLQVYSKVEYLGSQGMNVSGLVNNLNHVLNIFERGDNESLVEARNLLLRLNDECDRMLEELPNYVLWRNIRLYSIIGFLVSVPVLAYVFLPRIYIRLWYRFHKKWLVVEK